MALEQLTEYKDYIIIVGFVIGLLYIYGDILPITTTMLNLGANVQYVYMAVIGASIYMYYTLYWGRGVPKQHQQYVDPRNLNNPAYRQAAYPQPRSMPPPQPQQMPQPQQPPDMWDTFNQ